MAKYFLVLFTFLSLSIHAQKNEASVKASLIYYFTQYVIWPEEENLSEYKIAVYSNNRDLFESLLQISKTKLVKNKKFSVREINNLDDIQNDQVLYVGKEYNSQLPEIAAKITQKHVLLITDNYANRLLVMINFINKENGQKIDYEANKQTLKAEGFNYKNELLIYGGSLVDVKELLETADIKLQKVLLQISTFEKEIQNKEDDLVNKDKELKNKNITIEEQKQKLESLFIKLKEQEEIYKEFTHLIEDKQNVLNHKNKELTLQKNKQAKIISEINFKQLELESANKALVKLEKSLAIKQAQIQKQDNVLNEQANRILAQRKQIITSILLLLAVLASSIAIFRSYRLKKRLSEELEVKVAERTSELEDHKNNLELKVSERTNEIVQLNEELQVTNEELHSSNEMLIENKFDLEQALKKVKDTQEQLIQSEKMASLGLLTAGIAHEINNPVNFISGGQQLFAILINDLKEKIENKDYDFDEILSQFEIIDQSIKTGVDRTSEIVNSLRNYIRYETDAFVEKGIVPIIKEALLILSSNYKNRIEIIEKYEKVPAIKCIPGKLYQVFVNLISNAIDAIADKGTISICVSLNSEQNEIEIVISDTGSGIDKSKLLSVFNPFFTTKEVGKGTGLGLYIVYGIIEQHNGEIKVDSELGKGTTFKVMLPVI